MGESEERRWLDWDRANTPFTSSKEVQPPVQTDSDVSHVEAQPFNSRGMPPPPLINTSALRIFDRRDVPASCLFPMKNEIST